MKSEFAAAREFVRGVAARKDLVYIISKGKALIEQEIAHTSVIAVYQGQWADCANTIWDSTAIALAGAPERRGVVVGEDGEVSAYQGGGNSAEEKLEPKPFLIRNARTIDEMVFACGMKRQVYQRAGEKKWKDISAPAPKKNEEVGFEAIDGFSEKEIYAVGWQGEIWQYDGSTWTARKSPVRTILTAVCCTPQGVYAAGQSGVLLKGRNAKWKRIELGGKTDIWDLCWYQDSLYIATMTQLYRLTGTDIAEVKFGAAGQLTCYSLTTAEDVLWSIGRNDVASFDGKKWKKYA